MTIEVKNTQLPLFNLIEGERQKYDGMVRAANGRKVELAIARDIAVKIALMRPDHTCHADLVQAELIEMGINLGNAAGSIFAKDRWEFTGEFIKSRRVVRHCNLVRVWRLKAKPSP